MIFDRQKPDFQSASLDGQLDELIPQIRHKSEDLVEMEFFVSQGGKPWLEFRDDDSFLEITKHYFKPDNHEYLLSVNGNVTRGFWTLLPDTNKIMITAGDRKNPQTDEIYELVFLDSNFFILRKDSMATNKRKYLVLGYEPATQGLAWSQYIELLWATHSSNGCFLKALALAVFLIFLVVALSM